MNQQKNEEIPQNYLRLLQLVSDATVILTPNGQIEFANTAFTKLIHATPDIIINQNFQTFLKYPSRISWQKILANNKSSTKKKAELVFAQSAPIRCELTIAPLPDRQFSAYRLITIRDLTLPEHLKITEKELTALQISNKETQANAEKIISILENLTDGFIVLDLKWQFQYINKKAEIFTDGRKRKKLIGRSIVDELPWIAQTKMFQQMRQASTQQHTLKTQDFIKHQKRWYQTTIYPSPKEITLQIADITQHKEMEKASRLSGDIYKLVVENAGDLISLIDMNGKYLYVSPSLKAVLGYSQADLMGKNRTLLIHREDLKLAQENFNQAIASGKPTPYSVRFKHKQGGWKVIEGVSSAIFDEVGNPELVVLISRDVTERKKLDDQKDEFLSIASHELKTPLTSIKGYNQILGRILHDSKVDQPLVYMEKINTHTDKLSQLIGDLLDMSRIQGGKLEYTMETVPFDDIVKESLENVQQTTDTHAILMQGETKEMVYGDKLRLEQVITNLLTNAIKYSPEADKVIINIAKDSRYVVASVKDFGVGIPSEKTTHIFERFYRIEETSTRFSGLGIGLYISAEIINRHQGSIWAESEPGKGSIFYVSLPIVKIEQ